MKRGIACAIAALAGAVLGVGVTAKAAEKNITKITGMAEKHLRMFYLMNQWVKIKQKGKGLVSYFEKKGYHNIAVYGMSYIGETLLEELRDTSVQIEYGIDGKGDSVYTDIHMVKPEDPLDEVDIIVVTAITSFDEIEKQLRVKVRCPIVSLEDILDEI